MAINASILYNQIAPPLLNNSANLSYLARAGARNGTTPEDRRLDYFWRDAFMTVVTAYFFELCGRAVDANYKAPLLTDTLKLNQLAQLYEEQIQQLHKQSGGSKLSPEALKKLNYNGLDKFMHHRFMTQQLKTDNFRLVPDLIQHDLRDTLEKSDKKLTGEDQLKNLQAKVLVAHLRRNLNYQQLLEKQGIPTPLAEKVMHQVNKEWYQKVEEKLRNQAGIEAHDPIPFVPGFVRKFYQDVKDENKYQAHTNKKSNALDKAINEVLDEVLYEMPKGVGVKEYFDRALAKFKSQSSCPDSLKATEMPARLKDSGDILHNIPADARTLLKQAMEARYTQAAIKKVSDSGEWPKLALMLATNIVYFGVIGNWMDFNVIQPWQKKISDERGGVKELIAPAYGAIIPGALTVAGMFKYVMPKVPMLAKMGPAMQFMVAGTTGLGVFVASSYGMVMARLNHLRQHDQLNPKLNQLPAQSPAAQPASGPSSVMNAATAPGPAQSPVTPALPPAMQSSQFSVKPAVPASAWQAGFPTGGFTPLGSLPTAPLTNGFPPVRPAKPFNSGLGQTVSLPPTFNLPHFGQQEQLRRQKAQQFQQN
jgi:hypothetical protein